MCMRGPGARSGSRPIEVEGVIASTYKPGGKPGHTRDTQVYGKPGTLFLTNRPVRSHTVFTQPLEFFHVDNDRGVHAPQAQRVAAQVE